MFLIPFMLAVLLAVAIPDEPASRFTQDQRIAAVVWSDVCEMTNYVCDDVTPPTVRRSASFGDANVRGAYWNGSLVIWLDGSVRGTQMWLTIFHETVHYLQHVNTVSVGMPDSLLRCVQEREAWKFVNQYVDVLRTPQRYKRTLKEWRGLYGCFDRKSVNKGLMHDINKRSES